MVACNSYEGELKADGVDYSKKKVMYCFRIDKIDDIIIILSLRLGQRNWFLLYVGRDNMWRVIFNSNITQLILKSIR